MTPPSQCKYAPLEAYFRARPFEQNELALSFAQIETILGSPLPKSAYSRLTWWDNETTSELSHKNAWLNGLWRVANVDLAEQTVHFARAKFETLEGPIILHWGDSGQTPDPETSKRGLVTNEIHRLKIREHPNFPAWLDKLPDHTRQVVERILDEDATAELIELAQAAPDEEWKQFQFLGMLGGGNPDPMVTHLLTQLVLMEISFQLEH